MAKSYSAIKGAQGVAPGMIMPFSSAVQNDTDKRNKVPAGYIRCDGAILQANLYPALARIIGVGPNGGSVTVDGVTTNVPGCRFSPANAGASLLDPTFDAAGNFTGGTFCVPNLGSKTLKPGQTAGQQFMGDLVSGSVVERAGVGYQHTIATTATASLNGSAKVPAVSNGTMRGTAKVTVTGASAGDAGDTQSVSTSGQTIYMTNSTVSSMNGAAIRNGKNSSSYTGGQGWSYRNSHDGFQPDPDSYGAARGDTSIDEMSGFTVPTDHPNLQYLSLGTLQGSLVSERSAEVDVDLRDVLRVTVYAMAGTDMNGGERPNDTNEDLQIRVGGGDWVTCIPAFGNHPQHPDRQKYNQDHGLWDAFSFDVPPDQRKNNKKIRFKSRGDVVEVNRSYLNAMNIGAPGQSVAGVVRRDFQRDSNSNWIEVNADLYMDDSVYQNAGVSLPYANGRASSGNNASTNWSRCQPGENFDNTAGGNSPPDWDDGTSPVSSYQTFDMVNVTGNGSGLRIKAKITPLPGSGGNPNKNTRINVKEVVYGGQGYGNNDKVTFPSPYNIKSSGDGAIRIKNPMTISSDDGGYEDPNYISSFKAAHPNSGDVYGIYKIVLEKEIVNTVQSSGSGVVVSTETIDIGGTAEHNHGLEFKVTNTKTMQFDSSIQGDGVVTSVGEVVTQPAEINVVGIAPQGNITHNHSLSSYSVSASLNFNMSSFDIDMTGTGVTCSITDNEAASINELSSPFIVMEYIIKY